MRPDLSNQKLSEELGISRTHLANIMKGEYAQEILRRELHERKERVDTRLEELYNETPPNPSNRRFAVKIEADIMKALADKLQPNITRTENININIDIDKLQEEQQILNEAISRLPPTTRQQLYDNITDIRREWRIQ